MRLWLYPNVLHLSGLLLFVLATGGCSGPASVYLKGIAPLNVNEHGESTSVRVRVYQLRDDGRFWQAEYDELWTNYATALGEDMLGEPIIRVIEPGPADAEPLEVKLILDSSARFIGVVALYGPVQRELESSVGERQVLQVRDAGEFVIELRRGEVVLTER